MPNSAMARSTGNGAEEQAGAKEGLRTFVVQVTTWRNDRFPREVEAKDAGDAEQAVRHDCLCEGVGVLSMEASEKPADDEG